MAKGINKILLKRVIQILEKSNPSIEDYKVHFIQIILEKMSESDDCWLSICPFNYHYIGESFEKRLNFLEKN